eukprot:TRINITY_DN5806_c0_g1_i5.p1 TRINITY_DN5806_c0_g1~~TRINITY_DN5806_c0_g1_i5.p1  ORF type:complete len:336 (+),score=17.51 TRINITY_DN5806_c0_g1_i5:276-1283(+)
MKIGIIGGSGLYSINQLKDVKEILIGTPFGKPSDRLIYGTLNDVEMFFLPRHGRNHSIMPGELNHRANIHAMKQLVVTHIVSISAVGSLKEELRPGDMVVVDQYFDRTKSSGHTFFGNGAVAHVQMADPVCSELAQVIIRAARKAIDAGGFAGKDKPVVHESGTYVNMEGPAFSTRAESNVYRSWGMDVIGMTNLAEAKLAREAEIAYCTVAMVTDYDCWHEVHESVSIDMVIANLNANAALAQNLISELTIMASEIPVKCSCHEALQCALITPAHAIPEETLVKLDLLIGKYIKEQVVRYGKICRKIFPVQTFIRQYIVPFILDVPPEIFIPEA